MRRTAQLMMMMGILIGAVEAAQAQQDRPVGVVIGYPASVGVLWPVGDRVALRPEVSLDWTTTETTSTLNSPGATEVSTTTRGWTTAIGLSALFYLGPSTDELRFYVVPRAAYLWMNTDVENSPDLPQLGPYESDGSGFQASGAFGAEYAVGDRFRIFGELGLGYTTQESDTGYTLSRITMQTSSVGLRSGVGVVVSF